MIPLATISENPNFQFSTNSPPIFQFFTLSFHFRLRNTAVLRLPYQSAAVNLLSFQFKSCKVTTNWTTVSRRDFSPPTGSPVDVSTFTRSQTFLLSSDMFSGTP
ncbi:hypothetical protein F2Q68_00043959 [Brassica cretica]|uniref:Uncharacterized protein n=1 Tax=Brassica cretica TaxID=69181 RepID=A0A8S9LN06_BRACR|nr:hypothetical protein F2Q68_00043959 [Brassica cretica]